MPLHRHSSAGKTGFKGMILDNPHESDVTPRAQGDFRTTHWSVVLLCAGGKQSTTAEAALAKLCRTYWYPLYAFVRRRGYPPPDAEDLTQDFFAHLLEKKILRVVDQRKGKFRSFLLASVKNFLANDWNRKQTAKRGGQHSFVSWDVQVAENRYRQEPTHPSAPESIFEKNWALVLLEQVQSSLKQEYLQAGKPQLYESLQIYLSGDKAEASYAELGAKLKMTEGAVKMAALRLRGRYRELLRKEIANTVAGPEEVEEEIRHLLAALSM